LSARSPAFQAQSRPATLANIQSAIPAGAALIEFATYLPYNPQTRGFGFPRFVAYVVPSSGAPRWAALGTAARTDEAVDRLRRALRSSNRTDVKRFARKLDKLTMRPIRALLGDARRVFISPYGSLNLIPFVALVDERGRYLVERYSFSYLSSGRDLLRLQAAGPSRSAPLIVAAPAFGPASGKAAAGGELQASADQTAKPSPELSRIVFKPLPGAADEAQSLKRLLPGAQILMGEQATETALKQVNAPSILHIATHGFFLKDAEALADNTRGLGLSESAAAMASAADDPLLRSGLALAGANEHRGDRDDGILTALEVAGLDLWGTKLVALSACNTGVGEVRSSEGVYGLRRAQALAGSESQLMSLWPVSDRGTRDLMIAYYHALTRGQGRGDAPRQVQLRMLRGKDRRHPYYWASFIQSGEWKSLDGKEPNLRRR
jgi:CHAT domain-containing protein